MRNTAKPFRFQQAFKDALRHCHAPIGYATVRDVGTVHE
jgi:hypothetical protein